MIQARCRGNLCNRPIGCVLFVNPVHREHGDDDDQRRKCDESENPCNRSVTRSVTATVIRAAWRTGRFPTLPPLSIHFLSPLWQSLLSLLLPALFLYPFPFAPLLSITPRAFLPLLLTPRLFYALLLRLAPRFSLTPCAFLPFFLTPFLCRASLFLLDRTLARRLFLAHFALHLLLAQPLPALAFQTLLFLPFALCVRNRRT